MPRIPQSLPILRPPCAVTRPPVLRHPVSQSLLTPRPSESQLHSWVPLLPSHSRGLCAQPLRSPQGQRVLLTILLLVILSLLTPVPRVPPALGSQRTLSPPASLSSPILRFPPPLSPPVLCCSSPQLFPVSHFPSLTLASCILVICSFFSSFHFLPCSFEVSLDLPCSLLSNIEPIWGSPPFPSVPLPSTGVLGGFGGRLGGVCIQPVLSVSEV